MKELKVGCNTSTCLLCRSCIKEWTPAINANKKNFQLDKGERLFSEGDEMKGIFFVYRGLLKVHKKWGDDKELIVRFAKDGQIVGHRGLGKDNYFPVSATALEKTTVCYMTLDFFNATLRVNPEILYEMMMFFAAELKESEKNMRNLAHMPVKGRIAQALLFLKEKFGTDPEKFLDISLSRQDLASFVGTSYETLFRIMNEMQEDGAIKNAGRKIELVNEQLLQNFIAGK